MAGAGGSLVTSAGTWTFSPTTAIGGNVILLNGQQVAGGSAVELEVANNGNLYANNQFGWFEWVGSGWTTSANPTPGLSADGSILMAGTLPIGLLANGVSVPVTTSTAVTTNAVALAFSTAKSTCRRSVASSGRVS
jgi:hypothetical protein